MELILMYFLIDLSKIYLDYLIALHQKKYIMEDNRFIRDKKMAQKEYITHSSPKKLYGLYLMQLDFLQ